MTDETIDPQAPYGRKPDGTPYKVPLEQRIALGDRLAAGRAAKTAARVPGVGWGPPPVARASGKATPKVSPNVATVTGMLMLPAMLLGMAARFNPTFALDSVAIKVHAVSVAQAVDSVAQEYDQVQAFIDAAGKATPASAILVALTPLVMQIAANHGALEPMPEMGVYGPVDLLKVGGVPVVNPEPPAAESAAGSADVPAF